VSCEQPGRAFSSHLQELNWVGSLRELGHNAESAFQDHQLLVSVASPARHWADVDDACRADEVLEVGHVHRTSTLSDR
jgi:hypothetical protein